MFPGEGRGGPVGWGSSQREGAPLSCLHSRQGGMGRHQQRQVHQIVRSGLIFQPLKNTACTAGYQRATHAPSPDVCLVVEDLSALPFASTSPGPQHMSALAGHRLAPSTRRRSFREVLPGDGAPLSTISGRVLLCLALRFSP